MVQRLESQSRVAILPVFVSAGLFGSRVLPQLWMSVAGCVLPLRLKGAAFPLLAFVGLPPLRPELNQHTAIPPAGGLRRHVSWWEANCSSSFVLQWVKSGFPLWWKDPKVRPPPFSRPNHKGAYEHEPFVDECVSDLVKAGAAKQVCSKPTVVNPLNVTPKKNGKLRLILDLRHVNGYLSFPSFKLDSLLLLAHLANRGDSMFAIDLAHGYHQVQMSESSHDFLGFEWKGQYYVFTALPFGLASAPWCFTKVMLQVLRVLRGKGLKVLGYLDDFLFFIPSLWSSSHANTVSDLVLKTFQAAGLSINFEKSHLSLSPRLEHLGFVVDLDKGRFEVPESRWSALQALVSSVLKRKRVPVRSIAQVAGHLASMSLALGPVSRLFTRVCYRSIAHLSMGQFVNLSEELRTELVFWSQIARSKFTSPIWRDPVVADCHVLNTDAGNRSWGAVLEGRTAQGFFPAHLRTTSSTFRELLGVYFALQAFSGFLRGRSIQLRVDNQPLSRIIPFGSSGAHLHGLALKVFWLLHELDARLQVEWVPRAENVDADRLTRWFDRDDWQLDPSVFSLVDKLWGPHTIDRFAGHNNSLLPKFNSLHFCPGSSGVNALAQIDWADHNNWCNPPFSLIPHLLGVLRKFKAAASIVVPFWPSRPWWPCLLAGPKVFADFVVGCVTVPCSRDTFRPGPSMGNAQGVGNPNWKIMVLRVCFADSPQPPRKVSVPF